MKKLPMRILYRTMLHAWLVALITLVIFVAFIVPWQQRTFLSNLESKARGVAIALRELTAGSAVNEDYESVIGYCQQLLSGDEGLTHILVVKNDGFALVLDRHGWKVEQQSDPAWRPRERQPSSAVDLSLPPGERAFHYAQPLDFSGVEWGWIHIGLSLDGYDQAVASLYRRTAAIGIGCLLVSLVVSWVNARRLVRPIIDLQRVVGRVADGDLTVRASSSRRDELGNLATSIDAMTTALVRRDDILGSVQFAAQQFLTAADWRTAMPEVLGRIGTAAAVSRVYLLERDIPANACREVSWQNPALGLPAAHHHECFLRAPIAWHEQLAAGATIAVRTWEIAAPLRDSLVNAGVRAMLVIPVMVENAWWGCLGFDDCCSERLWTAAERDSLRTAADMLGATISRQRAQDAVLRANDKLEEHVRERTAALQEEVQQRRDAEADLAHSHAMIQATLESTLDGIIVIDVNGYATHANRRFADLWGLPPDFLQRIDRRTVFRAAARHVKDPGFIRQSMLLQFKNAGESFDIVELKDGRVLERFSRPLDFVGKAGHRLWSYRDITARKQAEAEITAAQQQLVKASRLAGMAEVANGVLHNVGNVLNTVNLGVHALHERLAQARVSHLTKSAELIAAHRDDIAQFMTADPRGRALPGFLQQLAAHFEQENNAQRSAAARLVEKVDHIKEIIASQQSQARVLGVIERADPVALADEAIKIISDTLARHRIELCRSFAPTPFVATDRHRIVQILVNLLQNAKDAINEHNGPARQIDVTIATCGESHVAIKVSDTGGGIAPADLPRIFRHGFTTKPDGHGFGLHMSAIAAQELNGALRVHSDGPGQGACFTVELPFHPEPVLV